MNLPAIDADSSEQTAHSRVSLDGPGPVTVPEECLADWGIAFILFVGSCFYLRLFYNYTTLFPDEGLVLLGAERILHGQVLYRDFFSLVAPGSYYWMALLFRVFGSSILVARAALVVDGAIFAVLTYLIARRVCSRRHSLMLAYLVTITCLPYYFMALHNWDSTLWAYLALYGAVRCLESSHWIWPALTGSFAALTCLFEQSKGAGIVFGLGVGFLLIAAGSRRSKLPNRRRLISFAGGFVWPLAVTFVYFGAHHSLSQMLGDCLWPLQHYTVVNKAFYGDSGLRISDLHSLLSGSGPLGLIALLALVPYFIIPVLPVLALGFVLLGLFMLLRRLEFDHTTQHRVLISAALMGLLLSTLATGRPDFIHLIFQAPLFLLVLSLGSGRRCLRSQLLNVLGPVIRFTIFVLFTMFGLALLSGPLNAHYALHTRRGLLWAARPDAVLEELQSRVRPGASVFIYPCQPLYYYLAASTNPARFDWLVPGLHTHEQFEEAIARVNEDRTPVILLQLSFLGDIPANTSNIPVEVLAARDTVAEYILAHYRSCKILDSRLRSASFVFMVRKNLDCSGPF